MQSPEILLKDSALDTLDSASTPLKTSPLFWDYVDSSNKQLGPMSFKALQNAAEEGKISNKTFVWHEKLTEWKSYEDVLKEN